MGEERETDGLKPRRGARVLIHTNDAPNDRRRRFTSFLDTIVNFHFFFFFSEDGMGLERRGAEILC